MVDTSQEHDIWYRKLDDGTFEPGVHFFVESVHRMGVLRATHEYNLVYWFHEGKWVGDETAHGEWLDSSEEECEQLANQFGLIC